MARLKSIWGDNACVFDPERFFNQAEPSMFKFVSFKAGPRICLGKRVAYLEACTVAAKLVRHFDFDLCDVKSVKPKLSLTLPLKPGLKVRLKKRS